MVVSLNVKKDSPSIKGKKNHQSQAKIREDEFPMVKLFTDKEIIMFTNIIAQK
jgi:hypothetical protein